MTTELHSRRHRTTQRALRCRTGFSALAKLAAVAISLAFVSSCAVKRARRATELRSTANIGIAAARPAPPSPDVDDSVIGENAREEQPYVDDDGPVYDPNPLPEPEPSPSPFAPALLRGKHSCWAQVNKAPTPPVIVEFYPGMIGLWGAKCANGSADVISTRRRPFFIPEGLTMTAMGCLPGDEDPEAEERFWKFHKVVRATFDIRTVQGRPRLVGAKGQWLVTLRPLTPVEMKEHCPELLTAENKSDSLGVMDE